MRPSATSSSRVEAAVYRFVRQIPAGRIISYGELGKRIGAGPRQVAAAMRKCPWGLPWHRVVGAGGQIRTSAESAWIQRERLISEGVRFRGRVAVYKVHVWMPAKGKSI